MALNLNSASSLGDWIRDELNRGVSDSDHWVRVITRETDRWFKNGLKNDSIQELAKLPARTGDPKWDALIEGVVAQRLHSHHLPSPDWTRQTSLDEGWDPRDGLVRDNRWFAVSVFHTPSELLEKGVVLPRSDLELV